jgi:ABC-type multidrug transport system fused ATPase/permease subunit
LQVEVFGSLAYVSQNSWIQSGTVRDNILFGKPFNKELYEKAIKSCALDKDIGNFNHGDLTEIGQRGLNMSGGQKQRIQLARAVYNDADIYLLDDPFSAVDAHTAAVLFYVRKCSKSLSKTETVSSSIRDSDVNVHAGLCNDSTFKEDCHSCDAPS